MKLRSSFFQRVIPKQIWQQIFLILVFLVVIPLLFLGYLLISTSQMAIKETVLNNHKEIALHTTGEIKEHVESARQALFVTASILGRLHADSWQQETAIVELALRNPAFQRVASVNPNGKEIVTSEPETELRDRSSEEAFQKAREGASFLSDVRISENYVPLITFAEPVKQLGKTEGVLISDLNLRSVWAIVDEIQIGNQGIAYIIDQRGRVIAHPDKKRVLQNTIIQQPEIIKRILSGEAGNVEDVDENNEKWLTSYAPIKGLNWGLVITLPEKEAYASLTVMKVESWILIILSVLGTVLISLILSRYMSQPMKQMLEGTQRITRGDYSYSFPIRSRSEIDKLLFSFNQMAKRMSKTQEMEKFSIVGKAATAIAHELKNSLQLVETFIDLLPERHNDQAFIKEFFDTIPKELDSWNTSLRNIMVFSKNSYAQLPIKELNVNNVVESIALLTKLRARHLGIHFDVHLDRFSSPIKGNEEQLKQVLLNLVTNALEATPPGGNIMIITRLNSELGDKEIDYAEIEVMNTGDGIKQEHVDKIFEPFYTTKSNGLGLGLSISKEIIERYGGRIDVTVDLVKQRTSFIVKIPIQTSIPNIQMAAQAASTTY